MKIRILSFVNGKKSYITGAGNARVKINGKDPISEEVFEADKDLVKGFMGHPAAYTLVKKKDKLEIIRNKNVKDRVKKNEKKGRNNEE